MTETHLTHGSDLRLAPSLGPLVRGGLSIRRAMRQLHRLGFTALALDLSLPGLRPRELGRYDRRELVASCRREGLEIAGAELFIPRSHYLESEHLDRALAATGEAITMAADLGRVPLSVALPVDAWPAETGDGLLEAADRASAPLAVHAEDQLEALEAWLARAGIPGAGAGLDPASLITAGEDPPPVAARLGASLLTARLSDTRRVRDPAEAPRCVPGTGALELAGWRIACDLAPARVGPVLLDLRHLDPPLRAAAEAARAWEAAG